jgi:glycosyltransferase involved in cell wall biosynthesis
VDESVTAIVPAFNEEDNILDTINSLKQIDGITEIIAINDGSTDNTIKVLKSIKGIKIVDYVVNKGKGHAIKSALPYVSNKYVLLVDADLKTSALEMVKLVYNTKKNSKNMLVAIYPKPLTKGGFGIVKTFSRKSLCLLTNKTSDSVLSGQRLIYTDFLREIRLPEDFGVEFKITLEALRNDITIIDIKTNIRHRETGRNLKDFLHRGKQFANILKVVIREMI